MTYPERTELNMTKPTWQQVLKIMKELQNKYQLPIFAATIDGSCSCCFRPRHVNKEAYLTPKIKNFDWNDVDSYIIFKNADNGHGKANLDAEFCTVTEPFSREDKYTKQYIMYDTSENFSYSDFEKCLNELIEQINQLTKTQYKLTFPKDKTLCPIIEKIEKDLS